MIFYRVSEGIRISAQPYYVAEQSEPEERRYVFVYHVRIENEGTEPAQLIWRRWFIHDRVGGDHEVEGMGVVGEQPLLEPGDVHEYQSYCVLGGPSGYMEGSFEFRRPGGETFLADIPRFYLRVHSA